MIGFSEWWSGSGCARDLTLVLGTVTYVTMYMSRGVTYLGGRGDDVKMAKPKGKGTLGSFRIIGLP
jgi:hypothetical protein